MSTKYSKADIVAALKAHAEGQSIVALCEQYGITESIFSSWLASYSINLANSNAKVSESTNTPSVANNEPIIYPPDLEEDEEKKQVKSGA